MYKLTSEREIPHYKKSKHLVFDREEIAVWMKSDPMAKKEDIEKEAIHYITIGRGRNRRY